MKDTTQLIADLRRYDSGEAVCELYDGGLHESAAACIEALQSQLAQYENCTVGNLLIDNLRMANEMTVLEREVARLREENTRLRWDAHLRITELEERLIRYEERLYGRMRSTAIEAAMKEEAK